MALVLAAPLEGITDAVFRRVHHACFGGVDAYYMPFISPTQNHLLTSREQRQVLPAYQPGVPCVPQVLCKDTEHFLWAAQTLAEMGYDEVNLNAGCPSGTVTAKGKGAGMLRDVEALDQFLDTVCAHSPIPVSVKTRIGFDAPEEWHALLTVYAQHPLRRLIVHPRTCREQYKPGTIHSACWQAACEAYPGVLVYNGDLFTADDVQALTSTAHADGVMLGRGLIANPALARMAAGGPALDHEELVRYHDQLAEALVDSYQQDAAFMKLRIVMKHLACCFADAGKLEKQIRKARKLPELLEIDRRLFETCELKPEPAFIPDALRD